MHNDFALRNVFIDLKIIFLFEKLKLAFNLAKLKIIENDVNNASVKLSNVRSEVLQASKKLLNIDVSNLSAYLIKKIL